MSMEMIVKIILSAFGSFVIIATALPLFRHEDWWIRIFDFPRLQLIIAALIIAGVFIFFWNTKSAWENILFFLLSLAILHQGYRIFPYTPFAAKQALTSDKSRSDSSLSLMISNVLMTNRNAEKYLASVKNADPDIFLAAETDAWWAEQLKALEKKYEYAVKYPLENTYGMMLFSRLKLVQPEVKFLVEPEVPSIHTLVELKSGELIELHCLHPKPPFPSESTETTERDAELLLVGKKAKDSKRPVVVAGDLNDVAWSYTTKLFQAVSKLLDPRIGRGMYNSFHAGRFLMRFPLDHVFHSNHFKLIQIKKLPEVGSDHFPIYIELSYEPQAQKEQPQPVAEPEDREEGDEKIEKARRMN